MSIFDRIRHRERIHVIHQASELAKRDPAKLKKVVHDYLQSKPQARRLAASEALLTGTLHHAPAPRQPEVGRALIPGICKSSKHYAAALRLAKDMNVCGLEATGLALGMRVAKSGDDSFKAFYKALDNALVNEISACQLAAEMSQADLEACAEFFETPHGKNFWEKTQLMLSKIEPIMFERQIDAQSAKGPQEKAAVAMLMASHGKNQTAFPQQVVQAYAKHLSIDEMQVCSVFLATSASHRSEKALANIGAYWKDQVTGVPKHTPLEHAINAIIKRKKC